jgi:predicted outer membrane repeat protein
MNRFSQIVTCVVVFACLCGASAAPAKVIYVDDDAAGMDYGGSSNNGSSWDHAFIYLQQALLAAQAGDEIRVAQGIYRPDQGLPPGTVRPRSVNQAGVVSMEGWTGATFSLRNGVTLLGGFAGLGAEDPDARDPQQYQTILSGDLRGNDVDVRVPGNPIYEFLRRDNSPYVVRSLNTDATAVLDGFVIQSAVYSGLLNQEGSPTLANCVFRKCFTSYSGSGLRCEKGEPTLSNCVFQDNHSAYSEGGAIYAQGARLTLSDCRFLGNWADREGGAICGLDSDLALTRCAFETNGARAGGAIHQTAGTLTLVECTFEGNVADDGGAVACAVENASITRCIFRSNWAVLYGGAVENAESPLTLDGCVFSGNTAGQGGALYALRLTSPQGVSAGVTTLTRCLLTGNRAIASGGALCSNKVEFTILGCTFADNQAPTVGTLGWFALRPGEALYRLRVENCIVWDGQGSIAPSDAYRPPPAYEEKQPDVVVRYSDVQAGWPGEGNIDVDPCFAAPGHWVDNANPKIVVDAGYANAAWVEGDYHLKSQAGRWDPAGRSWVPDEVSSPCIDAGDPNSPVGDEPEPNGDRINMGAYGGTSEAGKSGLEEL